ncbi:hypothetical protein [Paramicrobacterium humi]|uniref:hypothetical protein n=1 Tax=Paramicrobacterium humi TaxID=640635 RepID=UPI00116009E5|nr:hypothetical protein [Microbacterium humi]
MIVSAVGCDGVADSELSRSGSAVSSSRLGAPLSDGGRETSVGPVTSAAAVCALRAAEATAGVGVKVTGTLGASSRSTGRVGSSAGSAGGVVSLAAGTAAGRGFVLGTFSLGVLFVAVDLAVGRFDVVDLAVVFLTVVVRVVPLAFFTVALDAGELARGFAVADSSRAPASSRVAGSDTVADGAVSAAACFGTAVSASLRSAAAVVSVSVVFFFVEPDEAVFFAGVFFVVGAFAAAAEVVFDAGFPFVAAAAGFFPAVVFVAEVFFAGADVDSTAVGAGASGDGFAGAAGRAGGFAAGAFFAGAFAWAGFFAVAGFFGAAFFFAAACSWSIAAVCSTALSGAAEGDVASSPEGVLSEEGEGAEVTTEIYQLVLASASSSRNCEPAE